MNQRQLGNSGLTVSALGLGCMGMSFAYGGALDDDSIRAVHRAFELGVTFFDTAEVYGPFTNEELLGKAIKGLPRDRIQIATKFGFKILPHGNGLERMVGVDSRPSHVREVVEQSLKRLDIDAIDLLYQHRVDPAIPIEDVVGAMADLVAAGKVRHLGLCEVSTATLRAAHAVHPISAVQSEYSLWSREPERGVLGVCRQLGIGFVPYSPLGRGFLTGKLTSADQLAASDFRKSLPRFQAEALARNLRVFELFGEVARTKGCTPAQLALAWLLAQGDFIVPIPGARTLEHIEDNAGAAALQLSASEIRAVESALDPQAISGARYNEGDLALVEG